MATRILMVVENASLTMGGESSKNIQLFRRLRQKGIDLWMICHARCKDELTAEFPSQDDLSRIVFVEDTWMQKQLWDLRRVLPYRLQDLLIGPLIHIITQMNQRPVAIQLITQKQINLVFQPTPLSAKAISFMYGLGVPVVMGPLCGNLEFPPTFRTMDSGVTRITIGMLRKASLLLHQVFPGKLNAETLIYSDQGALDALPSGYQGNIVQMLEPAVDTSLWASKLYSSRSLDQPVRYIYLGRLVDWKGVQYLVQAFKQVVGQTHAHLDIVGDGDLRDSLETVVKEQGLEQSIHFHGWQTHAQCVEMLTHSDVFVMPSLRESGGHAVLEAMALGLPVIVSQWGGPALTVSPDCGVLVKPDSQEQLVQGLAQAMIRLANSFELRQAMGQEGPKQIKRKQLDWNDKCDRFIEIFEDTLARYQKKQASIG